MHRLRQYFRIIRCCLVIAGLTLPDWVHAQLFSLDWGRVTQTQSTNAGSSDVCRDHAGNTIWLGGFGGTIDIDPGPGVSMMTAGGSGDLFLLKLDANGNKIFAQQLASSISSSGMSLMVGPGNEIYVGGLFSGTADFDRGPGTFQRTSGPNPTGFVWKLTPNGDFDTVFVIPCTNGIAYPEIAMDSLGNLLIGGYFSGVIDLDPGPGVQSFTTNGLMDVFLAKWSPTGTFRWGRQWGSTNGDFSLEVLVNAAGESVIGGLAYPMDLNPGAGVQFMPGIGGQNSYFAKLDSNGVFVKGGSWGGNGTGNDGLVAMEMDAAGNYYFAGGFGANGDFDPGPGTYNLVANTSLYNIYVIKMDPNLNFVAANAIPYLLPMNMTLGPSGDYVFSIQLSGTMDLDPSGAVVNATSAGLDDIVIVTYSQSAAYIDHFQIGSTGLDKVYDLKFYSPDELLVCGHVSGTVDVAPGVPVVNLSASGTFRSALVAKFGTCDAGNTQVTLAGCDSVSLNNTAYTTSGTYYQYIPRPGTCDSVVIVQAIVSNVTAADTFVDACNSYVFAGQTLTASGTYPHTFTNVGGCDSVVTLHLTIGQPSSATITVDTCGSNFVLNGFTYNTSGTYIQHLTNAQGCDSTITLFLTIYQPSSALLIVDTCSASISLNGTLYTASGNYVQTLTNVQGCDSILTLQITLSSMPNVQVTQLQAVLTAAQSGASYQWLRCDSGNVIINGATSQTYTVTQSGSYAVQVTLGLCSDTSACLPVVITAATMPGTGPKLYPNPAHGRVHIQFDDPGAQTFIQLTDLHGRTVLGPTRIQSPDTVIDLPDGSAAYIIHLTTPTQRWTWKVSDE